MANFNGPADFVGSYDGTYDGRRATLHIEAVGPARTYRLTFTEVERNQVYAGPHQESGPQQHVLTGITLTQQGGSGTVTWNRLLLHTWDTTYMSGTSTWNGIDFGMFWRRQ